MKSHNPEPFGSLDPFNTWVVVKIRVRFWGTLNNKCRIILRTQKGTLILITTPKPSPEPLKHALLNPLETPVLCHNLNPKPDPTSKTKP